MITIQTILNKYSKELDRLDLELIIAFVLGKNREFVLSHPEYEIKKSQITNLKSQISRRIKHEPLAYILGEKEFYGLKFKVNKNTLIPRPETEMMIDLVSHSMKHGTWNNKNNLVIADIGTGSGNIIISLAHNIKHVACSKFEFYGTDISKKALEIARYNYKKNKTKNKINFLQGNLLNPILKNKKYLIHNTKYIILANLPYLSPKIYASCSKDIKKYEPKSALISQKEGLAHYEGLLKQIMELIQKCSLSHVSCFMEISPEQKDKIAKLIRKYFPSASWQTKITFHKDLSGRWRVCQLEIFNFCNF